MRAGFLLLLLGLALAAPALGEGVAEPEPEFVVYYFHGQFRCETCLKIEAWTKAAVSEGFAREIAAGNLELRVVNVQEEPNEHFADEFKLAGQAVILTESKDGKVVRWQNAEAIWDHLETQRGFAGYINGEVAGFLQPKP